MKAKPYIPSVIGGLLGFFAGLCACGCMISGFDLAIAHPQRLWLVIGAAALLWALACSFRRGWMLPLTLGILWLGWLWKQGDAWNQLLQLIFRISHIYRLAYATPELNIPGSTWNAGIADLPMQMLGCLITAVCCTTVCRGKRTWPAILTGALPLVLCLVVINTVPGEKWLFGLLLCLTLLLLTAAVRRSSALHGARLILITALPVAAFLACLFLGIPQESYVNKSETLRENILSWVENLPARAEETAQQITTAVSGSSGASVNLKTLGPQIARRYPVLEVTSDIGGTVYLREGDYDSYTGTGWTATPHRSEPFFCDAGANAGTVHIKTRVQRELQLLVYYPPADTLLTGGSMKNPENRREYTQAQRVLPENWREQVEQRYRSPWESEVVFTAAQEPANYPDALRYLTLPEETKVRAKELLVSVLSGDSSATAEADRIAAYVRSSAEYDRNTGRMPADARDFALWFLEEGESGYCVHFATAAVVLLRAAGIPARYVSGYMAVCQPGETVTVTADTAHAWAEYFEPQLGCWIPLEATPAEAFAQPTEESTASPSEAETAPDPTRPRPTQAATEPEIPAPAKGPGSLTKILKSVAKLLWVLIPPAILEGQRQIRLWLRIQRRTKGSSNRRALNMWREICLLARIRREQAPRQLFDLAQKAKFSQHTLTGAELAELETYIEEATARLRTRPWYERLVWRYLFAVL